MKLLICDDHELYREGLKSLLINHFQNSNLEVMEASNMQQVYDCCKQHKFNLVLLDLSMPDSPGVLGLNKASQKIPYPIAIISADERQETIQAAYDQDVLGYIPKTCPSEEIIDCIERMLAKKSCFSQLFNASKKKQKRTLSAKKRLVLQHLVDGSSNREIAESLFLSEGTVKQYVSAILTHLKVENRTQAALIGRDYFNKELDQDKE